MTSAQPASQFQAFALGCGEAKTVAAEKLLWGGWCWQQQQEKHPILRAGEMAASLSSVFGGGGSGVTEIWL